MHWHPFQLRPETPEGGVPLEEVYPARFLAEGNARLKAIAEAAGLPFNPPDRLVNTHRAHEAARFATERGQGDAFHRAVLTARFAEGQDVSDSRVLAGIATRLGLDGEALSQALTQGTYREAVDQELARVRDLGVSSVPTFVFPNGYAIAGAQPVEVFEQVMARPSREA